MTRVEYTNQLSEAKQEELLEPIRKEYERDLRELEALGVRANFVEPSYYGSKRGEAAFSPYAVESTWAIGLRAFTFDITIPLPYLVIGSRQPGDNTVVNDDSYVYAFPEEAPNRIRLRLKQAHAVQEDPVAYMKTFLLDCSALYYTSGIYSINGHARTWLQTTAENHQEYYERQDLIKHGLLRPGSEDCMVTFCGNPLPGTGMIGPLQAYYNLKRYLTVTHYTLPAQMRYIGRWRDTEKKRRELEQRANESNPH